MGGSGLGSGCQQGSQSAGGSTGPEGLPPKLTAVVGLSSLPVGLSPHKLPKCTCDLAAGLSQSEL